MSIKRRAAAPARSQRHGATASARKVGHHRHHNVTKVGTTTSNKTHLTIKKL